MSIMWDKRREILANLRPSGGNLVSVGVRSYPKFTVVGAGNGGLAMAAHLGLLGFPVRLLSTDKKKVERITAAGGIELSGQVEGFARIDMATDNMAEAVLDADVIMIVVPATAHRPLAYRLAPYLKKDQIVVLNPGRTGGALEFEYILRSQGNWEDVVIAEAQSLVYASRALSKDDSAERVAHIYRIKNEVKVAALPAYRTNEVVRMLNHAFPQFKSAAHVLETSLDNIGAIFHPAPTILNAARIEAGESFDYYHEGISPAVARILEAMDEERLSIARALGFEAISAKDWLAEAYGAEGSDLYTAIQNNTAYAGLKAPTTLDTRYVFEDVPMSLTPLKALGELTGVPTPAINSMIALASTINDIDYGMSGRTLEKLGLQGYTPEDLIQYVTDGRFKLASYN